MLDSINPKFAKWYGQQTADVQAQIAAQWAIIAQAADLPPDAASGKYARQFRLLSYCAATLGYDFT